MNANHSINQWVERIRNDDKKAFDELYHYYYPKLYMFVKSFLKVEDNIKEILQEVFIKLWDNRNKISSLETFNAWLFSIAKNTVVTYFREKIKTREFESRVKKMATGKELVFNDNLEYKDLKEKVDQIIDKLPEKRRVIFLLSRKEGLSNRDIAEKLGISIKTVEDHMLYAIRHLRDRLRDFEVLTLLYLYLFL